MRRRQRMGTSAAASCVLLGLVVACTPMVEDPIRVSGSGQAASAAVAGLVGRAAHTATTATTDTVVVAGGCVVDGCTKATASTS